MKIEIEAMHHHDNSGSLWSYMAKVDEPATTAANHPCTVNALESGSIAVLACYTEVRFFS